MQARRHVAQRQPVEGDTRLTHALQTYARHGGLSRFGFFHVGGDTTSSTHAAALLLMLLFPQGAVYDHESLVKVGVEPRGEVVEDAAGDFGHGVWWIRLRLLMLLQSVHD